MNAKMSLTSSNVNLRSTKRSVSIGNVIKITYEYAWVRIPSSYNLEQLARWQSTSLTPQSSHHQTWQLPGGGTHECVVREAGLTDVELLLQAHDLHLRLAAEGIHGSIGFRIVFSKNGQLTLKTYRIELTNL